MRRYLLVSILGGLLFGLLDALVNANPLAVGLYQAYGPIARTSVDIVTGSFIDLFYGFALAGGFLILYRCLPGRSGVIKGLSYALLIWFLRVVMGVASSWMMFELPAPLLLYTLLAGLGEMLVLGVFYGLTLKSKHTVEG